MKKQILNISKIKLVCYLTAILIFNSCSNTKFLADNELLLTKSKVVCDTKGINNDELRSLVKQEANPNFLFFFRFYTTIYNTFSKGKGTKFKKWMINNIGTAPVIYDEILAQKTQDQLSQYMQNKGYFLAKVEKIEKRKAKKIKVFYKIKSHKPYYIKNINYSIPDSTISGIVLKRLRNSHIVSGTIFDVGNLELERGRITRMLKQRGYYYFEKENISFEADSNLLSHEINLSVNILQQPLNTQQDSIILQKTTNKYKIRNIYYIVNYDYKEVLKNKSAFFESLDTLKINESSYMLYKDKSYIKAEVLLNNTFIKSNDFYSIADVEKTKLNFSQNLIFRQVSIEFEDISTASTSNQYGLLDCYIQLSPSTKQGYSINLEGTNTGGDWGAQVKTTYENKNLFKGAELFNTKLSYSFEQNNTEVEKKPQIFNSREFGIDISIIFPKFIVPFSTQTLTKRYGLRTFFKAGYSYQKIPYYERPISNLSYGYISKSSRFSTHIFTPFEINGIQYLRPSTQFNIFLGQNKYYIKSYEDYYISSTNYTYIWQNKEDNRKRDYSYLKYTIETAGNVLYLFSKATNRSKKNNSYEMFNVPFAQYGKSEIDYRYYNLQGKQSSTVYRFFAGFAIPYGNNSAVPNIKKYYAGGSNSMRAWSIKTLGPGSYVEPDTSSNNIIYAMGDAKIEANIEQRFPIFGLLNGALFIDAGNIWDLQDLNAGKGAQFSSHFFKELAIGTGAGLRFNFSFFVFRFDVGVKTHNPALNYSERWIWNKSPFSWKTDVNKTIAIGYPF